ncbi:laminin subunit alpha-5 isoform X2 [Pygocentrus nattereri]|uniref:laminin subunit alpha-5 isoform X2 n=1 Tax=Pygocentrus nattereri TaxID=42514 RepID=UPI001891C6DE|nr:laminin subunit alpha-5 isoform X2 [Pygocentrus nattereri]
MARAATGARSLPPGGGLTRLLLLLVLHVCGSQAQELPTNGVNGFSLHPPYFNLAEGTKITATATCGEDEDGRAVQDLYCKLVGGPVSGDPSQTIQGQYCDTCSSADTNRAHPITNAIDGTERWWQSPPLSRSAEYNQVNVTLDLGQLFHVAYVLIKFANSPRPDLWVLERSVDFGKTYQPWQFFASSKRDCIEQFGQRTIERIYHDNDVICTTEYSRIVPLENGEIVVSLVNGRPGAMNFSYSPVLREFTKATNIRLRFLRTNTLLGHLMGKALRDPTVTRRYYYSIKDISIGGRCVCNGHAEACNAKDPNDPYKLQCDCQHNTCGPSCDRCCPGFNQLPWKPATTYSANECEPCNCHGHAFDCYYDPAVDKQRASVNMQGEYVGGGVCMECQHHTTGINCERCVPGYYRSPDHPLESPLACSRCQCESEFTDGTCEDHTGRCYCKPNYTGERCDSCAEGYENFPTCYPVPTFPTDYNGEVRPAGEIINCECNAAGTEGNSCRPDPHTRTCVCKPGFMGEHCDICAPGHHGLNCNRCECSAAGSLDGSCDVVTGQCVCRSGFQGYLCDQCAPGYFNYPLCQLCGCSTVGTVPGGCDSSGRCVCRPEFTGPRCEQCRSGFHSYPNCEVCTCDPRTSLDSSCSAAGHCHCRDNYSGVKCDGCAPGYYAFPSCSPCQCSLEGSRFIECNQVSGQCVCLPNVVGQRCDRCSTGSYGFPLCQADTCNPAGSVENEILPTVGSCECKPYVEGMACDKCKPLYWDLSPDNVYGCSSCECNTAGTISGVAECAQGNGQCYCKPNVCSGTCAMCKDGYFNLQNSNYFGCQGCQCDIGGSAHLSCGERNGRCRCRPNVEGPKCSQPRVDHYFPDLHHMKFEVEEGTMLDGRPVRFGYNPLEFEGFSWRGYAQMSPIQPRVLVEVVVGSPDLFHVVLSYVNRGGVDVRGRVSVVEDARKFQCGNCSEQSKQIIFAPSSEPTFVNVPQNSFVEPFVLNPGTWTVVIEAEGILLDYLVLLPSAYYEAPILQLAVTEPCTYSHAQDPRQNCLMYKYLSLEEFPSMSGNEASCRADNHLPRPCHVEKITPHHPSMAICSGNDMNVQLRGRVPVPGEYVVVVEYASEDEAPQTLTVSINTPRGRSHQEHITLLRCKYSFLCRAVSVDDMNRVAVFTLSTEADVQFIADRSSFFLHKVFLIPHAQFTMEYLSPRVHCISTHGHFDPDSGSCVPSRFQTPSQSLVLKEGQASSVPEQILASASDHPPADTTRWLIRDTPPTAVDSGDHIRLDSAQNAVMYSSRVHALGRYVFILHYHQPLHPTFTIQVYVNGGRIWQGHANATFCPHGYGCRSVLISENQIILDVTDHEVVVTVRVPDDRTLWLDYVLVVPEDIYSSAYLSEEPLDKSYDFISHCGQNSFYINPLTASPFCRHSAASLSAFFNNGALPCGCHEAGSESDTCQPFGGQCPCKPNVIGRDCSQCATGYYGFPNCRPCNCGTRLCEPVTGECICPPRTVLPECVQCEPQTFGCHPLVGCEVCNCSRPGVTAQDINCDTNSGQCRCKTNIIGRQCDRCALGFYGYPNCRPCDCNEAGTELNVCDSITGQCLCKENVEGSRCDQCKLGTFHLDPTNPKGCTKCFCFGATDRCRSSEKRRKEIMDMEGWVLLRGDRQEVPVSVYPDQDLVEADLSDVPDVYQDLHWHAPPAYLGDKVSSYGGYLRYQLHTQMMRGDSLYLPSEASRPDVILKGNQMTLVYMEREYSSPEQPHEGVLHLVEGSFRHAQTGNAVSREELMMVLVALESLQIRALHAQSAQAISLRAAVLEGAERLSAGHHANNVEICLCPASYQGDSCQQCTPGFYRDTKGLFLGKCVPCNCNGHSDQCLDGSGICVNCQHNTAGDHCEKCRGGFRGNNTVDGHAVSCTSCPCPLQVASNNFAIGCVEKPNHMQCLCMPGYAGPKCERCAPGHYGNPMVIGSTCQPCNCNGNSDPNMLFSDCHPITGECQGCMHNSAGPHCEICAPGYYGDAVTAKNCTRCSCSPCGTASCDPHTGQCHCKPGVTGVHCDRCEHGAFGFETCAGCRQCDCNAAAALIQSCDPVSGSCACQPGVNGPNCHQCAPGHWNYTSTGCRRCDCKGGRCDPRSGECHCPPGLTGKQCDRCAGEYSVPVTRGGNLHCERCDSCVMVLLHDLDKVNKTIRSVHHQLKNVSASALAWAQLHNLNKSMENVSNSINNYNSTLDESRDRADTLEKELQTIDSDISELEDKASVSTRKGEEVENSTRATQERAQDLLDFVKRAMKDLEAILEQVKKAAQNGSQEMDRKELLRKLAEVADMLRDMRFRSTQYQRKLAENELTEANKLVERVKEEIADRVAANEATVEAVRDKLNKFHQDLMDLRDALNEAVRNTALAAENNNVNQKRLEENQQKVNDLRKKQKEVEDTVQMAEDAVAQVNDMLSMLQDAKEEYERLTAQLDGARQPLADKVQTFASSGEKSPLVEAAEKHAELLDQLAKNLSSVITDTNQDGFIQRALNASRAYTDIINSVKDADTAAKEANKSATEALESIKNQNLPQQVPVLKNKSAELLNKAAALQEEVDKELKPQLEDIKKRLKDAATKKDDLLKDLLKVQNYLNSTQGNTSKEILAAKSAVEKANSTAAEVLETLAPMKEKLDEWQKQYGSSNTTNEEINDAISQANKSVGALTETIPMLIKKLDSLQNNSIQMPNISENILRIRELIAEARKAANKVSVSMKFNGKSGVQVRTPSKLDDLAAYTTLKFHITLPETARKRRQADNRQFVFYLGNRDSSKEFMGMVLEGKKLRWLFKVGSKTAQGVTKEDLSADGFYSISLDRILQYGLMTTTSVEKTYLYKEDVTSDGDNGLLSLPAGDTVFYVGGYPSNFTLPPEMLQSNNFQGCIELESLNEEVISLYNFEQTFELNTTEAVPCPRSKQSVDAAYFDGTGYAEINSRWSCGSSNVRLDQEIKLVSQDGILLLLRNETTFICVAVRGGKLKLLHNFNGTLVEEQYTGSEPDKLHVSDTKPKSVDVIIVNRPTQRVLYVRIERKVQYQISLPDITCFQGPYFMGGVRKDQMPESLKPLFLKQGSIRGCFRRVSALGSYIDLKSMNTSGVSFGCPDNLLVAREAHFKGQNYLDFTDLKSPKLTDNFYAGLGFRTEQKNGLLLQHQAQDGMCQVFLEKGNLVVIAGEKEVRTQKTYNDDNSHYVAFYSNENGLRVYVDDVLEPSANRDVRSSSGTPGNVYIGGTPESSGISNLTGCLSNLFINRTAISKTVVDLLQASDNVNVPLECPDAEKPQQILASPPRHKEPKGKQRRPAGNSRSRSARESCSAEKSVQEPGAYHFSGSSLSHMRYDSVPPAFSKTPHVAMGVQVSSSSGLIFHAAAARSRAAVTLSVSEGHLMLLVNGGKRKTSIVTNAKYDDGIWHTVFVKIERDKASLIVDGINAQSKKVSFSGEKSALSGPVYIGGLPSDHRAAAPGFVGCIRDVKLNEVFLSPSHSVGVVPCYQEPLQPGVYFSAQGGRLAIDESLVLGQELELELEVRPVSDSGLLLHAGGRASQQLSVYLNQGTVTVLVNGGDGEVSVSLTPEDSLCDGNWHTVFVVKKSNVIQLRVDAVSKYGVSPKRSRFNGANEALYLGNVPDAMEVPGLPASLPPYHGCVRKAVLNGRPATLTKPSSVSGAVGTQGCPAM